MKIKGILLFLLFCINSFAQQWQWASLAGQMCYNASPIVCSASNGEVFHAVTKGNNYKTSQVSRVTQLGSPVWTYSLSGPNTVIKEMLTDKYDHCYILGYYTNSLQLPDTLVNDSADRYFIIALDLTGTRKWLRFYPTTNFSVHSLAIDASNNLLLGTSNGGDSTWTLRKINSGGTQVWLKTYDIKPNKLNALVNHLKCDAAKNIYAGFSTNADWVRIGGLKYLTDTGYYWKSAILQLDSNGIFKKVQSYIGADLRSFDFDGSGKMYVFGYYNKSVVLSQSTLNVTPCTINYCQNIFIARIGTGGTCDWYLNLPETFYAANRALAVKKTGEFFLAGAITNSILLGTVIIPHTINNTHQDLFVCKFSSLGTALWAKTSSFSGSSGYCGPADMEATQTGEIYIAGSLYGSAGFNTSQLQSTFAEGDWLLIKLFDTSVLNGLPESATDHTFLAGPNPSSGEVKIKACAGDRISLYDLAGRMIFHTIVSEGTTVVDLQTIPSGVYLMEKTGSGQREILRFIRL